MDIEGYEWAVLANMMETGVFNYIRQYMLEFHLFPDFPLKQDYVYIYTVCCFPFYKLLFSLLRWNVSINF